MWNRRLFHSFSFRAGLLIFVAFCTVLLSLRMMIYYQAVRNTEQDIKAIILAHSVDIRDNIGKYNSFYAKEYIRGLLADLHDPHFFIAFYDRGLAAGNLYAWPYRKNTPRGWVEFALPQAHPDPNAPPRQLIANITHYADGRMLLVGYDLSRLQLLKATLGLTLAENVAISFAVAFLVSLLLIYLLNRHMRHLNQTCQRIMQGELAHRVKLSGADDEFERLAANINAMLDRNTVLLHVVQDSTNALAHDMRTPLSRLRNTLQQTLDQPNLPAATEEGLSEAMEHTDGLVHMFENLLQIAKAESRADMQSFQDFDLSALVQNVTDFYATFLEDKKQILQVQLSPTPVTFRGDQQLIAQAVSNLLDNAVKYTPLKGTITVSVTTENHHITCIIADNGPGIPEAYREKVKARFFRLDESRHEAGTGLGMSLADAVAKLHNGELRLEDNAPGLRAILILPRAEAA